MVMLWYSCTDVCVDVGVCSSFKHVSLVILCVAGLISDTVCVDVCVCVCVVNMSRQ